MSIEIKKGKKKTIFTKLMVYLLSSILFTALLSTLVFYFIGGNIYGKQVAQDLLPYANSIAKIASDYCEKNISIEALNRFISGGRQRRGRVIIYDSVSSSFLYPNGDKNFEVDKNEQAWLTIQSVLKNGNDAIVTRIGLVLVSVPIIDSSQSVIGAVVVMKPSDEFRMSLFSIIMALIISCAIVSVFMVFFAYFGSKSISSPLRRMEIIASKMAAGDFTQRATPDKNDEIGRLGSAINNLSEKLAVTIHDLKLEHERLDIMLNTLNEGVASFYKLECTYINPALLVMLDQNDVNAINWSDIIPDFFNVYNYVVRTGEERRIHVLFGQKVLQCSFLKLDIADNRDNGILLMMLDITEAERLEQTRKEYVANVSHELKTPITSIRSLSETLNDGLVKTEEDKSRYYGNILRESIRMSHLIDELLELSRLQSGTMALDKKVFNLNDLINSVADRMKIIAGYSGLEMICHSFAQTQVFSNRSRIEQVLIAIIDNAIKYCEDGGIIDISCKTKGTKAIVCISNTGEVNSVDLPHLFERFYKADKSHKGNGSGLGLAITKELLNLLGERINVISKDGIVTFSFSVTINLFE